MKWSQHFEPNNNISYDHVLLDTPLGEISIEWKSWKERPSYDIYIDRGDWLGTEYSLEDAQLFVFNYLYEKLQEFKKFMGDKVDVCECMFPQTSSIDTFSTCQRCHKNVRIGI